MAPRSKTPGRVRIEIETTPMSGVRNMERDRELLRQAADASDAVTLVRFYQWDVPTVSLGRRQTASEAVDVEYCRRHAIPCVVRPTGGLAVLHADELTYAVASNDGCRFPPTIPGSYLAVARALRRGFSRLGVDLDISPGSESNPPPASPPHPCFVEVSRHELTHKGRKLVGSAQLRTRGAFLQHGSIPLSIDYALMSRVFRSRPELLRSRFVGVGEAAGREIGFMELAEQLRIGFDRIYPEGFRQD